MAADRTYDSGIRSMADVELDAAAGGILFYQAHQGQHNSTPAWLHDAWPDGPSLSLTPTFVSGFFGNPGHVAG